MSVLGIGKRGLGAAGAAALVVLLSACGSGSSSTATGGTPSGATQGKAPVTVSAKGLKTMSTSIGTVLVTQLSQQLAGSPELIPLVEQAAARYAAGEPIAPDPRLPEQVRMVFASFETPANLPFARELWTEDATQSLPRVTIPTLVVIGGKDVQIDVHADGAPLQEAATGMANVAFTFPVDANHVLKHEPHTREEVLAGRGIPYNDDSAELDPEAMADILEWLGETLG